MNATPPSPTALAPSEPITQAGERVSIGQQVAAAIARSIQLEEEQRSEAITLVYEALEQARAGHSPTAELECLLRLTNLYELDENHEAALECGLQAIDRLDERRRDVPVCRFLQSFGRTLAVIGEYDRAIRYVREAYDLARSLPDPVTEGYVYLTLSLIYSRTRREGDGDAAIKNALAMPAFDSLPAQLRGYLLHDAAWHEHDKGNHDRAFELIEQARALFAGPWMLASYAHFLKLREGDAAARRQLEEALAATPPHDHWGGAYVRSNLARMLIEQGEVARGVALLQEVVAMPKVEFAFQEDCLGQLAFYAVSQGDYQRAYEYQLQRNELQATHFERLNALRSKALDGELRSELARREQQALAERNTLLEQLLAERTQGLEQQQRLVGTIAEISTPVLPLVPGVLVLPIIGTVDSERMQSMVGSVLEEVTRHRAQALILDITGVPLVDTQVAAAFLTLARSVKLLGCRCVLVGIRPEIAQALVGLGITLGELITRATLADGLAAVGITIALRTEPLARAALAAP